MPLSEHEQRLFEQIERSLAEDPKFASAVRATDPRFHAKRRMIAAAVLLLAGMALLVYGVAISLPLLGVGGFVVMLGSLAFVFTNLSDESTVLSPSEKTQVSKGLEKNAEVMTNTHLAELLKGQPRDVQEEIIDINTKSRPIALQIALLVPLIAALVGLLTGFRMTRLPDPEPSGAAETLLAG